MLLCRISGRMFMCFVVLIEISQAYWIRDLSFCPRKREAIRNRQCFKSCFDDSDCRSRYRSCACDFDCGMSCIKRGTTCRLLPVPEHGTINYSDGNKFGSRATYECEPGYVLEGGKHRHCQGDRLWGPTDMTPYCTKEVFCSRPPDIANAVNDIPSMITTFHAGYTVNYHCITGYTGNGTTTSECTFLGQWTFTSLKCTPIDCGSPGPFPNGFLSGERFDYPNIIAFFCHDGYELIGESSTRACQENGLWSGKMPKCQPKTCSLPPIVSNSHIIQPDRTTNETVQYICQDGYRLIGSAILNCVNARWQPDPPICEEMKCEDPQEKFNGLVKSSSESSKLNYSTNSTVTFECPSNLTLVGRNQSTCQPNGTWKPKIPLCQKPAHCPMPSLPRRAHLLDVYQDQVKIDDGHFVEYVCGKSSYRRRVSCHQGKLIPNPARCFQGCRVKNDTVLFSKSFYRHRERIQFICPNDKNEYTIINDSLRCFNGNLSGKPVCARTTMCTVPHLLFLRSIINQTIPSGTLVPVGESFSYVCADDHEAESQSGLVKCISNGKWSHYPRCLPKSCSEPPPSIKYGRTIYRSNTHGSHVHYRCFPGYQFQANLSTTLVCHYGSWLPTFPAECLPLFCANPGQLTNGRIFVILNDHRISSLPVRREFRSFIPTVSQGRTISFECNPGYQLRGPSEWFCNQGRWTPDDRPSCVLDEDNNDSI